MSNPKKKSRLVTVFLTKYRWTISPEAETALFVAEKEGAKGRKIAVRFTIDSSEFPIITPDTDHLSLPPRDIENIIKQALKQGWKPDEEGPNIAFDWHDDQLTPANIPS